MKNCKLWSVVFKQQFSVFLKIRVGEKVCENKCNIV